MGWTVSAEGEITDNTTNDNTDIIDDADKYEEGSGVCPSCGQMDFSQATVTVENMTVSFDDMFDLSFFNASIDGSNLCSDPAKVKCDGLCGTAKIMMSMNLSNPENITESITFNNIGLIMKECVVEEMTCAELQSLATEEIGLESDMAEFVTVTISQCDIVTCDSKDKNCPKMCHYPKYISGGFKESEGFYNLERYARYTCYPQFVMTPNMEAFIGYVEEMEKPNVQQAYMDLSHNGVCYEGTAYLPSCTPRGKAGHCGLPTHIENGHATYFEGKFMNSMTYNETESEDCEEVAAIRTKLQNQDVIIQSWFTEKNINFKNDGENGRNKEQSCTSTKLRTTKGQRMARNRNRDEYEQMEQMDEKKKELIEMMPWAAHYECKEDHVMQETVWGDWGWCRKDGSYEIPACVPSWEFYRLEFKLDNGDDKTLVDRDGNVFGGIVLSRPVSGTKVLGEWEAGCNDGFNDYAAGAVCRQIAYEKEKKCTDWNCVEEAWYGFQHGSKIQANSRMLTERNRDYDFGWTKVGCTHDDTLMMSDSCDAMRYEEATEAMGMKAKCFDFDRLAIRCFDTAILSVDVSMGKSRKMVTCRAWAEKEEHYIRLGAKFEGLKVSWMMDDKVMDLQTKYKVKKGKFVAQARLPDMKGVDFECMSCEVYADTELLGKEQHCKSDMWSNSAE